MQARSTSCRPLKTSKALKGTPMKNTNHGKSSTRPHPSLIHQPTPLRDGTPHHLRPFSDTSDKHNHVTPITQVNTAQLSYTVYTSYLMHQKYCSFANYALNHYQVPPRNN